MHDELTALVRSYGVHASPSKLRWPSLSCDDIQDFLIDNIINSSHFTTYAPSDAYQRSFWKRVISEVEGSDNEVNELIYSHYLDLLSRTRSDSREPDSFAMMPPPSFVTYTYEEHNHDSVNHPEEYLFGKYRKCTLLEAGTLIQSGTTGLRSWTASFVLADYLLSRRDRVKSSRILELGSGAGLLGIILAQIQTNHSQRSGTKDRDRAALYLTDLDDQVLERCEKNVHLPCNDVNSHPCLKVKRLDWEDALVERGNADFLGVLKDAKPDLIVGADLIYDVSILPALAATLRSALRRNEGGSTTEALIAATIRKEVTLEKFLREVESVGLHIEDVSFDSIKEGYFKGMSSSQIDSEASVVKIYKIS